MPHRFCKVLGVSPPLLKKHQQHNLASSRKNSPCRCDTIDLRPPGRKRELGEPLRGGQHRVGRNAIKANPNAHE